MKLSISKITTAIAFSCLLSASAIAQQDRKQEKTNEIIGLSSGVIIGSVLAGPLGGLVAGIFGVMLADDVNTDNRLSATEFLLEQKDQQLMVLQRNYQQSKDRALQQIASMDNALEQATYRPTSAEIESNIQFKTASYDLQQHYQSQLDLIAQSLQLNPALTITLSGFADKRGDRDSNLALSQQRVLTVKKYLLNKGVKSKQVITHSFGESALVSAGIHFEDDFFDRRVLLKISSEPTEMTASNQ